MSFFETLKAMGLFPNQQAPAQGGGDYTAGNPYGLDPAMLNQARWASLGNISSQLLALGQQMRPQDRAQMMGNMDLTGGLQQNLFNAAQMKLAQRRMMQDDLAIQQATDARTSLAEKIRSLPQGRLRDAAMFYLTAGDVDKAAEVIYKAEKRLNPMTGDFELVNSFDLSPIGGAGVAPGGVPMPAAPGEASTSIAPPAASAGGVAPMPAAPAGGTVAVGGGQVDKLTTNWRRLTGDPNLTPEEARQISMEAVSKNDPAAGLTLYREIRKQQQAAAQSEASLDQTTTQNQRTSAQSIKDDFDANAKGYQVVMNAAEFADQVVSKPDMSPSDKLSVIYNYAKTNDPAGAVQQGDMQLMNGMNSWLGQLEALRTSAMEGGTITNDMVREVARTIAMYGNRARNKFDGLQVQAVETAKARGLNPNMVFGRLPADQPRLPYGVRLNPDGTRKADVGPTNAPAVPAPPGTVRITNDAEFEALQSGTVFVGPDGVTRRKP